MNYLKYHLMLEEGDLVEVTLDHRANVRLMDRSSFADYTAGRNHRYYGGYAKKSPVRITAPRSGSWILTVDLGGKPGRVRSSVRVVSPVGAGATVAAS